MTEEEFYKICCLCYGMGWFWQTIKATFKDEISQIGETAAFEIYNRARATTPKYWKPPQSLLG